MKNNVILTLVLLLMRMSLYAQTPCPNTVINGDFEAGNSGFTSSLVSSCECVANSFCVNTNFNRKCAGWPNFGNHTSGGANFLLIDGSTAAGASNIWASTVPVSPGDTYTFSFWVASVYPTSQQVFDLGMVVNGITVKQFTISQTTPTWTQYTFSGVCPPNLRSMPIAIRQMSGGGFRDFGLDDIYFACCPCKADYTTTNLDNCRNFQFNNTSTGAGVTYSWDFGDTASGVNNTSSQANPTHLFSKCGKYEVCLTLKGEGCSSKICYSVDATDNIPPLIACPRNLTVNTNPGQCYYTGTLPQPTVSDNCAKTPEIICSLLTSTSSILITPQTQFPKGVNTINCIARDECGNTSRSCTYTLTVKDNQAPVITCPISMSVLGVKDAEGRCKALISGLAPTVSDNCPMTTLTYAVTGATTASGSNNLTEVNFMEGVSTVTYTAVDMDGNKATCSFTVTVRCPCEAGFTFANLNACGNVQFTNTSTGTAPLTYAWNFGDPNSGTANNTSTLQNPSHQFSKCGTYEVCLTITGNGCSSKVCKTVVIKDDQVPKIVCPPNVTVSTNPGQCYFSGKLVEPKATDNCDKELEIICSTFTFPNRPTIISPQTQFQKGEHVISCIAVDDCGNVSETCTYTLTVVDKELPIITCPANVTVQGTLNPEGLCKAVVKDIAPKASDNCPMLGVNWRLSGATIGQGIADASGTNFMQGVTMVTYTAVDMAGNEARCSFTVTVECKEVGELNIACGMAVATCFSGLIGNSTVDLTAPVIALFDVRDASNPSITLGDNWGAPKQMFLEGNALNCGQVFGLAIDKFGSIFTTTSTIYGNASNIPGFAWGPGGSGAIYRFTYTNGAWVRSVFATLPNGGSGLGNITYDKDKDQFFVTNFHDGLIYRIPNILPSNTGMSSPSSTYLHNGPTTFPSTHADFVPLGKRLWGIGYNPVDKKVYFARWNEDTRPGRYNPSTFNEIRSIKLQANGDFDQSTEQHEFWLPNFSFTGQSFSQSFSNPVSDIEFSENGDMLIAEKTMLADIGFATNPSPGGWAHKARILQYKGVSGAWGPPQLIHIGNGEAFSGSHNNSAGGVDYGYEGLDKNGNLTGCDSLVWGSGDALMYPGDNQFNGSPNRVYGIAAMPVVGNTPNPPISTWVESTSIYVDLDGNLSNLEKLQIGDVDIFNCACPAKVIFPCDSLEVSYAPVTSPGEKKCCYSIDLTNKVKTQGLTKICANLNTSGWIFNTGALTLAGGWVWDQIGTNQLCFKPQSGNIPVGQLQDVLTFCLAANNPNAPTTQQIVFEWYAGDNIVCKDTIRTECSSIAAQDTCVVISNLKVKCLGENDLEYCMTFDATNLNNTDVYGLILGSLPAGYSYADCGCGGSVYGSGGYLFSGFPLIPANSTKSFCVKIIASSPVLSPTKICFNTTLEFLTECCSSPKDWCVELKPCCDPCEQTFVTVKQNGADSCCYSLDFNYNCDFKYYTHIDFDILTPGVSFGWHTNDLNWDFYTMPTLTNVSIKPDLGAVQPGTIKDLFSFCLTDINQPSEIPQQVKVTYWTTGSNGKDSIACDTILDFNCEYKKDTCLFVTNEEIRCIPDSMKYEITVTVQNLSVPNFTASYLGILAPGITPNPIPLSPPLGYGASQTVTFCYTPTTWPDPSGKLILIYRLKHAQSDSCCNGGQVLIDTLMLPPCDTCLCGTFSDLTFRPAKGAPNMPIKCGDTLGVSCNPAFNPVISGNFQCVGDCEADSVHWELFSLTSNLFVASGDVISGNFSIAILAAYFSTPGTYALTLSGQCGGKSCPPCKFIIKAAGCPCCADFDVFCQSMMNHVEIKVDSAKCKATLTVCNIRACDYIQSISWGDGSNSAGPFGPGAMSMHTYTGSGTYIISYLAIEKDPITGKICFEKRISDTITIVCKGCACKGVEDLSFGGLSGASDFAATCGSTTPVELPCSSAGAFFYFHGNVGCDGDSCLGNQIGWSIGQGNLKILSGTLPISIASGGNQGHFDLMNLDPAMFAPGVVYTLNINWTCGGKSCSCSVKFVFKGCPDCACGKFTGIFLRPNSGPSIALACGEKGPLVPCPVVGQPFSFSGSFACQGDNCPKTTPVKWTLIGPDGVGVAMGTVTAMPNFSINLSPALFGKKGEYCLKLEGYCGAKLCECLIKFRLEAPCPSDDCACGTYSGMFIRSGQRPSIPVVCGCNPVPVGCPPNGQNLVLTGQFQCQGQCPKTTLMDWVLIGPNGPQPITSGTGVIANPNFSINIDPSLLTQAGVYTLKLIGHCGNLECPCVISFIMDPPCPKDSCECGDYELFVKIGKANLKVRCRDTIDVPGNFGFYGSFGCKGNACPDSSGVSWTLDGPRGFSQQSGYVIAKPDIFISPLDPANLTIHGLYTLSMVAHCGGDTCLCTIYFRVSDYCCKDSAVFLQNAKSVQTFGELGNCFIRFKATGLTNCMRIWYDWGDGKSTGPITSNNVPITHTYTKAGKYVVCYTIEEVKNGLVCQRYTHCDTVEVLCRCDCGELEWANFLQLYGNFSSPIRCDNNTIPALQVPCPKQGQNYFIHGNYRCVPDSCGSKIVNWVLDRPGNLADISGVSNSFYPHFDINLQWHLCTTPGTYVLKITRNCGGKECVCAFKFEVPACPCLCGKLKEDVALGFNAVGKQPLNSCKRSFIPSALCPGDIITWSVNGVVVPGTTTGNNVKMISFNGPGNYLVCMTVLRTDANGQKCEGRFCQKVKVKCNPGGVNPNITFCSNDVVKNGDFTEGAIAGHLGGTGVISDWNLFPNAGRGFVFVNDSTGSGDAGHLVLNGGKGNFAGVWQKMNLQPNAFTTFEFDYKNYLGKNSPAKTVLEFRLESDTIPGGPSQILHRQTISDTSAAWSTTVVSVKASPNPEFKYLIICAQNDDEAIQSLVGIDNLTICTSSISDTKQLSLLKSIRIFPNPNPGKFTVELSQPATPGMRLRVTDLAGRLVLEKTTEAGNLQQTIQAEYLSAGMYFLQVVEKGRVVGVEKFVKQ